MSRSRSPIIVKVGSALLVAPDGTVRTGWLATLVAELAALAKGRPVGVVTSGAIALGARRLGLAKGGRASLEDAQAAAATGQIALAGVWSGLLAEHGLTAAQLLVTLDDFEDRRRYLNIAATLERLFALGVVPVINENDTVATEEIRFGDNDRLAARVAVAAGAAQVVLLSDVDGLHTADPSKDPRAERLQVVPRVDARIRAMAGAGSGSGMGSGGMASKLAAADLATRAGVELVILSGLHDRPLARLADGAGTRFIADTRAPSRKAWLAGRARARGVLTVDAGAAEALAKGASLLAAGVTGVEGSFSRGELVAVQGPDGTMLARGISEYDAAEVRAIAGARRDALAERLGYAPRSAVIHRNHMVRA